MRPRPLAGRELWRIGDWGGASAQIGRRWEHVGATALGKLIGPPRPGSDGFQPRATISFVDDPAFERAIHGSGLTNADALLVGFVGDRPALQPIDFKWSLEVARPEQVAGESLRALLEAEVPVLQDALRTCLESLGWQAGSDATLPSGDELALLDGLFLAPRHAANTAFLDSPANLRQERPLTSRNVVFEPVDGQSFFSPLPGWQLGELLAGQEGARRALQTVEGAERYYRLGAGIQGALVARRHSIFDSTPPDVDGPAELAELRRTQRLPTTEQVIAYLDRVMSARSELKKSFNQLGRQVFPFAAFRRSLRDAGIALPDRDQATPADRRWSRLYGQLQRELTDRLATEGRALVSSGQTDAQALAALQARGPDLAREAAARAAELIASEQAEPTSRDDRPSHPLEQAGG